MDKCGVDVWGFNLIIFIKCTMEGRIYGGSNEWRVVNQILSMLKHEHNIQYRRRAVLNPKAE